MNKKAQDNLLEALGAVIEVYGEGDIEEPQAFLDGVLEDEQVSALFRYFYELTYEDGYLDGHQVGHDEGYDFCLEGK